MRFQTGSQRRSPFSSLKSHLATALLGVLLGAVGTYAVLQGPGVAPDASEQRRLAEPGQPGDVTPPDGPKKTARLPVAIEEKSVPPVATVKLSPPPVAETEPPEQAAPAAPAEKKAAIGEAENKPVAEAKPAQVHRQVKIGPGDTLMEVLLQAGAGRREAHGAITAMREVFDPRRLRPGHQIDLVFEERIDPIVAGASRMYLVDLSFQASIERQIVSTLTADGFKANEIIQQLRRQTNRAEVTIEDSLYLAAVRAGIPVGVVIDLIHIYSFDIDFQRDIQPGDRFEVFYETFRLKSGEFVRSGEILYARLHTGGAELPLYRFLFKDGEVDFYNDKGHSVRKALMKTPVDGARLSYSVRKALMKTPVDGARLSSRFGRRRHPILGFTRMHRGVDFAAPRGTPIMAAGSGTLKFVGRKGGYGKYIQIRHNSEFSTAYAHMKGYAKGMRTGKRVQQGQTIGYVGSTGRSTGPHLHYEILRNNRQINPLGLKLPTGRKLKGEELKQFMRERDVIREDYKTAPLQQRPAQGN